MFLTVKTDLLQSGYIGHGHRWTESLHHQSVVLRVMSYKVVTRLSQGDRNQHLWLLLKKHEAKKSVINDWPLNSWQPTHKACISVSVLCICSCSVQECSPDFRVQFILLTQVKLCAQFSLCNKALQLCKKHLQKKQVMLVLAVFVKSTQHHLLGNIGASIQLKESMRMQHSNWLIKMI